MQTQSVKLPKLIQLIRAGKFEIPQFQRSFVWREAQVKLVVDSIARGYPIGSFLVMNQSEELQLHSRPIEAMVEQLPDDDLNTSGVDVQYVLDGQQRMTSITRVFLNGNASKIYYFDLLELSTRMEEDDQKWVKAKKRTHTDSPTKERLSNNRLLRADLILDQMKANVYVQEYIEDGDDFRHLERSARRQLAAKIGGIFEGIRNYDLSLVVMDGAQGLESICRVFETINSTGTRLTTFDLAVARFYPEPDLRRLHEQALDAYPLLKQYGLEGERILQVIHMVSAFSARRQDVEPTRSALLRLPQQTITELWNQSAAGLAKAFTWATNNGVRPEIPAGEHILTALGAVLTLRPELLSNLNLDPNLKLRQWFYSHVLQSGVRASNYVIGVQFMGLMRYADGSAPLEIRRVELSTETLLKLSSQDNRYRGVQCLMALNAREDLLTGAQLSAGDFEYHHIFPRSLTQLTLKKLDNVLNFVIVTRETNRTLSNTLPSVYMRNLLSMTRQGQTNGALQQRLHALMLPPLQQEEDLIIYDTAQFDAFLTARANLVINDVRNLMGEHLAVQADGQSGNEADDE